MKEEIFWLVMEVVDGPDDGMGLARQIFGIFDNEEAARALALEYDDGAMSVAIGPITLNKKLPREFAGWDGLTFPASPGWAEGFEFDPQIGGYRQINESPR